MTQWDFDYADALDAGDSGRVVALRASHARDAYPAQRASFVPMARDGQTRAMTRNVKDEKLAA